MPARTTKARAFITPILFGYYETGGGAVMPPSSRPTTAAARPTFSPIPKWAQIVSSCSRRRGRVGSTTGALRIASPSWATQTPKGAPPQLANGRATIGARRRRPSRATSQAGSPLSASTKTPWTWPSGPPPNSATSAPNQLIASAALGLLAASVIDVLLQQLAGGGGGGELAPDHPVQQLRRSRVLGDGLFEPAAHPRGGDAEHLAAQVAGAALGQRPLLLDEGAMLVDLGRQLLDALAARRLGAQNRHLPSLGILGEGKDAADLADHRVGHRVVGLVDDDHVGDLHHPRLQRLDRIAGSRHQRQDDRVAVVDDVDLRLADADGLDQDVVFAGGVHDQ